MYKSCLPYAICMFVGCAKQPAPLLPSVPEAPILSETDDCPEGVKTGCNVPDVTQSDLDANEQIEVLEMPLADYLEYETMEVQHSHHAAALFYLQRFLAKNPDKRP